MFECMGMGVPIVHGVEGESAKIVTSYNVGIPFEPENAESLSTVLKELMSNPALHNELRRNGLSGAKSYNRKNLANDMLKILEEKIE